MKPIPRPPKHVRPPDDSPPEKMREWWVVDSCGHVWYHGCNIEEAREAREDSGADDCKILGGGYVYPSPAESYRCQCKDDPEKQKTCTMGHPHECHYPFTCAQAKCAFLELYQQGDPDSLADCLEIRADDHKWSEFQPPEGPCSRCGHEVRPTDHGVVIVQEMEGGFYRFCRRCIHGSQE